MSSYSLFKHKYSLKLLALVIWMPLAVNAVPEALSEADRIAVEEKLKKIQGLSEERVGGLYSRAIRDFRSAIQSDSATLELYLKCVEKVQFTDERRKNSEFREWKRKNKEKLSSKSMCMALRHQLSWLLLSIEAAKLDGDLSDMGERAITHLNQIFKNAEVLKAHKNILREGVLDSVFARAYKLNIKVEGWPKSALDIANVFDKVVMPPLRNVDQIPALREAWDKRILYEGMVFDKWSEKGSAQKGAKAGENSPELANFLTEMRPVLLWQMEMECFELGDERNSVQKMVKHLETYLKHKDAPEWIEELQALVIPRERTDATSTNAGDTGAE